jgi:Ca2+-binding EF-hand superfamily protein
VFPNGSSEEYCKAAFSAFDKNRNGYIEFDEFMSVIAISLSKDIKDKIKLAFEVYDQNHDGVIERKEAKQVLQVKF